MGEYLQWMRHHQVLVVLKDSPQTILEGSLASVGETHIVIRDGDSEWVIPLDSILFIKILDVTQTKSD